MNINMRAKVLILGLICFLLSACLVKFEGPDAALKIRTAKANYLKTHLEISSQIINAILNGDVLIGMTVEQVIISRGKPCKIKRTTGSHGIYERWTMVTFVFGVIKAYGFDKKAKQYAYIYFENGIVTSWQSR